MFGFEGSFLVKRTVFRLVYYRKVFVRSKMFCKSIALGFYIFNVDVVFSSVFSVMLVSDSHIFHHFKEFGGEDV